MKKELSFRDKTARMIMARLDDNLTKDRKIQVAYSIIGDMERAGWNAEQL